MKTLIHVSEIERWNTAISNSKNLITYTREREIDLTLEIVVNGPAVKLLARENADVLESQLKDLISNDVKIVACENALKSNNIDKEDLLEGIGTVPAGVAELIEKQAEGYAYIKA